MRGCSVLRKILQHIVAHQLGRSGVADAEPYAPVRGPDIGIDAAQPVVACGQACAAGHNGGCAASMPIVGPDRTGAYASASATPDPPELVRHYVLQDFAKEERPLRREVVEAAVEAFPMLIAGDANGFMNKVNLAVNPQNRNPIRRTNPIASLAAIRPLRRNKESWDFPAASSACPMSASRPSSTR